MNLRWGRLAVAVLLGSGLLACGDDPVDGSDADGDESSSAADDDGGGGSGDLVADTCAIFQDFIEGGEDLQSRIDEIRELDVTSVEEGEEAIAGLIEAVDDLRGLLEETAEAASELDGSGVENGEEFVEVLEDTMGEAAEQAGAVIDDLESIDLADDPEGAVAIGEALEDVGAAFEEIFVPLSDERFQDISDELDADCEV